MANLTRDFFIGLSNNKLLNTNAKKYGFRLGAEKFVAGTNFDSIIGIIKDLNGRGISCTLDNLGEFVTEKSEAIEARDDIIDMLYKIHEQRLDCHVSVKLTQLGLDIGENFCLNNMRAILKVAKRFEIFINIDMEKHIHYGKTLETLNELRKEYDNVGTVIQSYLYSAEDDLAALKDVRIRLVKGAYKEDASIAYPSKEDIDRNFMELAKKRLLGNTFTSIATHDHNIIDEIKTFVEEHNISRDVFEFQMLYGFRTEMHEELAQAGYHFCTYIPFGSDWFGYFMRRLAERPQNINLVLKDVFYTKENKLKKEPVIAGVAALSLLMFVSKKRKK